MPADDINARMLRFHVLQLCQRESASIKRAARDADTFDDFRNAVELIYNDENRLFYLLSETVAREYVTQRKQDVTAMFEGDDLQLVERLDADEMEHKQRAQNLVDRELNQ